MDARPARFDYSGFARLGRFARDEPEPEYNKWDYDYEDTESLHHWHWMSKDWIAIECDVLGPKADSPKRKVTLHLRGAEIEWLLKILREAAIKRRQNHE